MNVRRPRRHLSGLAAGLGLLGALTFGGGCLRVHDDWRTRTWEEVDGEVVRSRPVYPSGYEAYARARLAMAQTPPDLPSARTHLEAALRSDPKDPHLWTTLGELEALAGDDELALGAAEYALKLRPGYPPATDLIARLNTPH